MSATYNYNFKRWSLRGKSDLMSITAMPAMTTLAYDRMAAAAWIELAEKESDLPPHDWAQSGFLDSYDAAKYCGDYADGKQVAYACAACYSVKIPADALAGTVAKVEAILATVYGDRWLAEGAIISAFLTASATPPAWADIVDGSTALASSPDPAPAADAVTVPDWQAPLRQITRSNTAPDNDYAATLAPATATDATAYLHVVIRLSDYIAVPQLSITGGGTRDSAWIEGGAKIDGTTLAVTFDRAVTPDGQAKITLLNEFNFDDTGRNDGRLGGTIDNESAIAIKYTQTAEYLPAQETGDATMMRRLLEMRETQTIAQLSNISGTVSGNIVARHFDVLGGFVGCRYAAISGPPAWHQYRLHGMLMSRSTCSNGETVDGLSLDVAIPTLPVGQIVRIAMYAHSGPLPYAHVGDGDRFACNIVTMASACDPALILGTATSIGLGYFMVSTELNTDTVLPDPPQSVDVIPLGTYDLPGGSGLAANAKIPFAAPYTLPRFCVIFVAINVIGYTADWVAAPATSTAVQFKPSDLSLHIV